MCLRCITSNAHYLSHGLAKLGFINYGHTDSPIVPLLLYNTGKMCVLYCMMRAVKSRSLLHIPLRPWPPHVCASV